MGIAEWMLNLALKVLVVTAVWMFIKFIFHDGRESIRELLETIRLSLRAFGCFLRKKCLSYLRKEEEKGKEEPAEQQEAEDPVPYPTYEEYAEWMRNRKTSKL